MSDSVWPHRWQPTRLPHPWDSPGKNTGVGCHFLLQCRKVKSKSEVAQSCPTLSDCMDCSLPGSSIHGIFQAGVLEWSALAFSAIQCYRYLNNCCYEVSPHIIHLNRLYSNLLDFRKNSNVRHWTQCWGDASVKGLSRVSIVFLTGLVYFEYWETGWGEKM